MIKILDKCQEISQKLEEMMSSNLIGDYRIYLRTNESLCVYIRISTGNGDQSSITNVLESIYEKVRIDYISDDCDDDFYNTLFENKEKLVYDNGRRRLNSLFRNNNKVREQAEDRCKIITFYSYKGGMGRSTTLASFATYLALKKNKNVFIIDCDIEAPGFNNFFLKNPAEPNQQQGLMEYLLDKETGFASSEKIKLYSSEVGHEFSGKGNIRVMHAGNLDITESLKPKDRNRKNLDDYIEGLSRLDIVHTENAQRVFTGLFEDIKKECNPDVILIDSKTGISDVMGLTVCSLSDIVVGFFRNDSQSLPGLYFFLKSMIDRTSVEPFLVNSILPYDKYKRNFLFDTFKENVSQITEDLDNDTDLDFPCFGIYRDEELEVIGTAAEHIENFTDIILNDEYKPYKELFESLYSRIDHYEFEWSNYVCVQVPSESTEIVDDVAPKTHDQITKMSECEKENYLISCKKHILGKSYEAIKQIDLYADNLSIEDEIKNSRFFFRSCMNDLFNPDKYMILGSKGTGKSYLYNTLRSDKGIEFLKEKSRRAGNYIFKYTIDKTNRIFHIDKLSKELNDIEIYRFWMVYTWNSIASDLEKEFPSYKISPDLGCFDIKDDDTTREKIENSINDTSYVQKVEKELQKFDDYLSGKSDTTLTILYDQLDEIVNPLEWNTWIPQLINILRNKKYVNISGKMFVRKDLFRSLVGITNKKDIENKAIDIEWSKEEVYSYYFRIILSNLDKEFLWSYMDAMGFEQRFISQCRTNLNKNEQFKLDDYLLRPLVGCFFGKQVDTEDSSRMGTPYDWFYKNLKNADDSISLRPFIELLKKAMELQKSGKYNEEETVTPVLYQKYYTDRDVRKDAVERHYRDLVDGTIGNKPIDYIFDYIANHHKYKYVSMPETKFEKMLENTISANTGKDEMNGITVEQLKSLLITNGIVKKDNHGRGTIYVFSFLYKYVLGLRKV